MSTIRNISMMLAMAAGVASSLPANADECITRQTFVTPAQTIQVVPQSILMPTTFMPTSTVKTTKTTVTTTSPNAMLEPTFLSTPETTSRTIMMMGSAPASSSSSTVTTLDSTPFPVYGNRLAAMREQIDRSAANGWINSIQAENLRTEASRLGLIIANRNSGLADTDSLERSLTSLNLSIQDAMKANGSTAGLNTRLY